MKKSYSSNKLSDNVLLDGLKKGNSKAFDVIFCNFYKNLCRYAYMLVRDEDMAQSLVQAVFIKLWENRESLGHINNLSPYLTVMVRNHCINFINREKRTLRPGQLPTDKQTENVTENQIIVNEFEEKLFIAVSSMPERCKEAFEYSRFDNLTNKEIAAKMGISIKGVEALICRSLKSLRVSLLEYLPSTKKKVSDRKKELHKCV